MVVNEGVWDRTIRVAAGAVLSVVALGGVVPPDWDIVIGAVGGVLLLTGAVGWCPIYTVCHVTSAPKRT